MKLLRNLVLAIQDAPNISEQPDNPDPVPNYQQVGLEGFSKLGNHVDENDMVGSSAVLMSKLERSLASQLGSCWVVPSCPKTKEFLMLLRGLSETDPLMWNFPGGHLEEGERPEVSAAREFEEETGLKCPPLRPLGKINNMFFYLALMPKTSSVKINKESVAWGWFKKVPPSKSLHPPTRALLHGSKLGQKSGHFTQKDDQLESEESSFYDLYDLQGYGWGTADSSDPVTEEPGPAGSDIFQPSDVGMS